RPFSNTYTPDRHNTMSYFAFGPMTFTPMQVARLRQMYRARFPHDGVNETAHTVSVPSTTAGVSAWSSSLADRARPASPSPVHPSSAQPYRVFGATVPRWASSLRVVRATRGSALGSRA